MLKEKVGADKTAWVKFLGTKTKWPKYKMAQQETYRTIR